MTPALAVRSLPTGTLTAWLARFDADPGAKRPTARVLADVVDDELDRRVVAAAAAQRALTVPTFVNANAHSGTPSNRRDGLDLTAGFAGMRR